LGRIWPGDEGARDVAQENVGITQALRGDAPDLHGCGKLVSEAQDHTIQELRHLNDTLNTVRKVDLDYALGRFKKTPSRARSSC
jgi:hypothetical protein